MDDAKAGIGPHADYRVYDRILRKVHRKSGVILDGFQLPTAEAWAKWCGVSERQFYASVASLARHGFLSREAVRSDGAAVALPPGQHRTGKGWHVRYQPQVGRRYGW